ncbi:MAG: DUF1540 domain-containing protein [Clostridia bacterium]|nr:DUF1540 domain-containing protein [Clostridia bacterium]
MNCNANHSIRCTVRNCKNHCTDQDYCALNCVSIGTHEANPSMDQCTDCLSYVKK